MPGRLKARVLGGLSPHQAAIDRDHRARHIVGQVGRQKLDHLDAILDRPLSPKATNSARSRLLWLLPGMTVAMILPVAITPGATQLAVTPNGTRSSAGYRE